MMKTEKQKFKEIIGEAVLAAGKYALERYKKFDRSKTLIKAHQELLTKVDLGSERIIINQIKKYFPEHRVISEEAGDNECKSDYSWIIDPIDGTTNFTMHNPLWAISVALAFKNEIILGIIFAPVLDEFFWAEKGKRSHLNGKKIKVSGFSRGKILNTCCSGRKVENVKKMVDYFTYQKIKGHGCYLLGSAALEMAYVATGRIESLFIPGAHSWDVAAGVILVREAGGRVSDISGKEWQLGSDDIIVTNNKVHNEILKIVK